MEKTRGGRDSPADLSVLRQNAEKIAGLDSSVHPERMTPEEIRAALHELTVHQIELEMQNEELRRTQAEIETVRAQYFDLYDMAPVGYCTLSDKGIILQVNLTIAKHLGGTRAELIRQPFSRYVYKDDQDAYYLHIVKYSKGSEPRAFELRMQKKDGTVFWANIDASVVRQNGEKLYRVAISDITERKQAEEARERLSALMDHNPSLVFLKDEEGRYVYLNKAYETHFIPSGDWYGKTDFDFWPKESAELFRTNDAYVLNSGQTMQFMEDSTDMEGKRYCWLDYKFPFTDSENRKYIGGIGVDATRLILAEQALRESEEKYRELVKHAPAGIYELDFRNNRFISVNDVLCELSGYSREDFQNMSPFDLLDSEGKELFKIRIEEWLFGREPEPHADYKVLTKDGRELYVSLNVSLTKDASGAPLGAMVIAHDVTARRKMEKALRRSEEELRNADASKNNFISMLSHELRNPLAAISAGIQILDATQDVGKTESAKAIMKRQMDQLCKLVDDLLDLTRVVQNRIKLKKESVLLNETVAYAAADIRPEFETKGVHLWEQSEEKPVFVYADPVRLAQCVGNILHNALKFTPAGGDVWVSLKLEENEAVIRVKDNGIGIDKETLAHLFSPFTQADQSLDRHNALGLGLGLSIVKGIVDMHGGKVHASSDGLGKGALFSIGLPVAKESAVAPNGGPAARAKRGQKILIIEDNPDLTEILCSMFAILGYQAFAACDGMDGIKKAKEIRPAVIFCDIGLPGKNGYEIARIIKGDDELKSAFLVALTGYVGERDIEQAKESGFDGHLAKPVDMASIERVLAEVS